MTNHLLLLIFSALALYLALLALGRLLKRRAQLDLGFSYQVLALSAALLIPVYYAQPHREVVRALLACLILSGSFFLLAILKRALWERHFQEKRATKIPKFVSDIISLILITIAITVILGVIYEIRIPGLLTGSGIVAIILGLSMQETLGNIIAGLALQFEKAFKTGDWLIVGDRNAEVMEINWRSTRLRATDNVYFDIPNSQLARQTVVNLSYPQRVHAMRLSLKVENSAPPNRVRELLLHATAQAAGVLPAPAPSVFVNGFFESAIEYEVKFWLEDQSIYHDIRDRILTNIWYELDRAGIRLVYALRALRPDRPHPQAPAASSPDLVEAFHRQPVFRCLDETQIKALLSSARSLRFGRGETLIEQDAPGASMFLLLQGEAEVLVRSNGHFDPVATLRDGDFFGEMSLLTGEKRAATVLAKSDCNVIEVKKEGMAEILRANPNLAHDLSELLAQRQLENDKAAASHKPDSTNFSLKAERSQSFLSRLRSFFEL